MTTAAVHLDPQAVPREAGDAAKRSWFDAIVDLSRTMLDEARAGHWERVSELQSARQHQLESFFSDAVPVELAGVVSDGVRTILELDRELMSVTRQDMQQLSGSPDRVRTGRRAQRAYSGIPR